MNALPTVQILHHLLRPIMRFCIRHSLHAQDLIEAVKVTAIQEAEREIKRKEEKVNISRLSAITGLQRREVMRIHRDGDYADEPQGLINRVIGFWQLNAKYSKKSGEPKALTFQGEGSEFWNLVRSVSQDLNPGTILFELERTEAIEYDDDQIKLKRRSYTPTKGTLEGFSILARDSDDLMRAVEENILDSRKSKHLHAKTEFDNVALSALPEISQWLMKEGSGFHERARKFLSRFDRDITPDEKSGPSGARVVIGTFSYVSETANV